MVTTEGLRQVLNTANKLVLEYVEDKKQECNCDESLAKRLRKEDYLSYKAREAGRKATDLLDFETYQVRLLRRQHNKAAKALASELRQGHCHWAETEEARRKQKQQQQKDKLALGEARRRLGKGEADLKIAMNALYTSAIHTTIPHSFMTRGFLSNKLSEVGNCADSVTIILGLNSSFRKEIAELRRKLTYPDSE